MKTKLIILIIGMVVIGLLSIGLLLPNTTVSADDVKSTPGPWRQTLEPLRATAQALPTQDPIILSNHLQREKLALSNQAVRLEMAATIASTTQAYINEQKTLGKDTSSLENALASFNQSIQTAKGHHDTASSILADPAGFDSNGQVTDKATARQTIHTAGQALRQVHLNLTNGSLTLRQAVKAYRAANKPG
jgi:hypothetical protein